MSVSKEEYDKAKEILQKKEYLDAKATIYKYEAQVEAEERKKRNNCDHDWKTNENSPPWERTFYCTKCGIQEDGYGEQW